MAANDQQSSSRGSDSQSSSATAQQTKQQAQQLSQQAQQAAGQVAQQAKSQAGNQKQNVAQNLSGVSQALQQSGQQLQKQGQGVAAQALDTTASQINRFAQYLENTSVEQMVGEVQNIARRDPAVFLGGAFALGFLLSRFLKSSAPSSRSHSQGSQSQYGYQAPGQYGNRGQYSGPDPYGRQGPYSSYPSTVPSAGTAGEPDTEGVYAIEIDEYTPEIGPEYGSPNEPAF